MGDSRVVMHWRMETGPIVMYGLAVVGSGVSYGLRNVPQLCDGPVWLELGFLVWTRGLTTIYGVKAVTALLGLGGGVEEEEKEQETGARKGKRKRRRN